RVLFSDVSFRLTRGDRAGLIGPNGTGKTTLLRIVAGLDEPDTGSIALPRGTRIGFLQQELLVGIDGTVEAHARAAGPPRRAREWLETLLVDQDATVLTSSHDRWFLDRVTSRTLSFEPAAQGSRVVEYRGGYSQYARQRAGRDASLARAAARQQEEIARTEEYIDRFRAGQRSKQSRGRAKQLARLERIDAPRASARHGWTLEAAHLAGATVLES